MKQIRTSTRASARPIIQGQQLRRPYPIAPVISGILLVAIAVLVACALLAPHDKADSSAESGNGDWTCPYDWSGLSHSNGRFIYEENGAVSSQLGIDVSEHQGSIDWDAVKADGIEFAIIRVGRRGYTEGGLFPDERCDENLDNASAAGLEVGAYFFSQAITVEEAGEEADLAIEQLKGRTLDLPVAFDHETISETAGRADHLDKETLTSIALVFCERLEAAGYETMIYGNTRDLARFDLEKLGNRVCWLAQYDVETPLSRHPFAIWQYTSSGYVDGISTQTDINLRFTNSI